MRSGSAEVSGGGGGGHAEANDGWEAGGGLPKDLRLPAVSVPTGTGLRGSAGKLDSGSQP